jgi:ATP-dependent DNA helicase DinG
MKLVKDVSEAFGKEGLLARCVPNYLVRAGQSEMAVEVARTMEEGGVLAVEAGTGIGKTYAYLVPALLSGERVLVSTATKALQDQLYKTDIPKLLAALSVPVRAAVLKGRSSYLCLYRLSNARLDATFDDPVHLRQLAAVETWALETRSGDLADVVTLDEHSSVIPLVSSTRDNCLGGSCPQVSTCHVNLARRNAMAADLVVVNHHLFFADLNVRESGVAELLPTVKSVVFDEAHQINEIGVQFMGHQLSSSQLESIVSDVRTVTLANARGFADWDGLLFDLRKAIDTWCRSAGRSVARTGWVDFAPAGVEASVWVSGFNLVASALTALQRALAVVSEISPELSAMLQRLQRLQDGVATFQKLCEPDYVRWVEFGNNLKLYQSPLDIALTMRSKVLPRDSDVSNKKSWIFTSATLGHEPTLRWFIDSCGLKNAKVLKVESPFDYAQQASCYVPVGFPAPNAPQHPLFVAKLAAEGAVKLGGRTLVLTTTLKAMRQIGGEIRSLFLSAMANIDVWVQGEAPKQEIIRAMHAATETRGCLVVASASFWEGVDLPGTVLQLLVVDKLPFAPPDDPIQHSRAKKIENAGGSAFKDLHLPHAAIALKQGAGRLIRRETDRGILVLCDVRLTNMGYGKKLLAALPPMRRLETADQYHSALQALTKLSTTDLD